ncbi:MAG: isoprenylcysteine carboxylmethyltransferase family protein [Chloroflexota bacterium]|nr:isoprenylcysteine carboxylmethyltransferase family protein [Chloroflexota bacterium]
MSRLPSLGPRGEGWLALQLLLLLAIVVAAMAFPVQVDGSMEQIAQVVGLVGLVAGVIVFGLGIVTLGGSLSPLPKPLASAELVERGIYRFIRHPIYTGLILAALGGSIHAVSPLALLFTVALAVVLDLKARREEIWLRQQYAGYTAYAARTKKFIPLVY